MLQEIKDKVKRINKLWLTVEDIAVIMECGMTKASNYRKKYLEKKGTKSDYFHDKIPTVDFLKFYKVNTDILISSYDMLVKNGDLDASSS